MIFANTKHSAALLLASAVMCLTACGGKQKPAVTDGYNEVTKAEVVAACKAKAAAPYTGFEYTVTAGSEKKTGTARIDGEWPADIPLERGEIIIESEAYFDDWGDSSKFYKNPTTGSFYLVASSLMAQEIDSYFYSTYYYLKVLDLVTVVDITWTK